MPPASLLEKARDADRRDLLREQWPLAKLSFEAGPSGLACLLVVYRNIMRRFDMRGDLDDIRDFGSQLSGLDKTIWDFLWRDHSNRSQDTEEYRVEASRILPELDNAFGDLSFDTLAKKVLIPLWGLRDLRRTTRVRELGSKTWEDLDIYTLPQELNEGWDIQKWDGAKTKGKNFNTVVAKRFNMTVMSTSKYGLFAAVRLRKSPEEHDMVHIYDRNGEWVLPFPASGIYYPDDWSLTDGDRDFMLFYKEGNPPSETHRLVMDVPKRRANRWKEKIGGVAEAEQIFKSRSQGSRDERAFVGSGQSSGSAQSGPLLFGPSPQAHLGNQGAGEPRRRPHEKSSTHPARLPPTGPSYERRPHEHSPNQSARGPPRQSFGGRQDDPYSGYREREPPSGPRSDRPEGFGGYQQPHRSNNMSRGPAWDNTRREYEDRGRRDVRGDTGQPGGRPRDSPDRSRHNDQDDRSRVSRSHHYGRRRRPRNITHLEY
ncbi:hypothetical protein QBC37DRAFT_396727 [Rhypophila decipiens]|uniref:Uncharacterized protein n=1 Tax=Rhypophila decipiens TaxID=261697 RepID=A0AAN6YFC4_9PEZI|nr:hypothetical protein QBC37DRAFT_396727 [Rhypophila decipiens]